MGEKLLQELKSAHQHETVAAIQHLYESYNPGFPFIFSFLDEAYQKQYDTETRVAALSKYFAGLAIIISCLGSVWISSIHRTKKKKRNRYQKSDRRFCDKYYNDAVQRFFKTDTDFISNCISCIMVDDA